MTRFSMVVFLCALGVVGCASSIGFDGQDGGATQPGNEYVQKWWNCFIDSNTDYDNTEYGEILWLVDGDTAEDAAERVLPNITSVLKARLESGDSKLEGNAKELIVKVLYCEPNDKDPYY